MLTIGYITSWFQVEGMHFKMECSFACSGAPCMHVVLQWFQVYNHNTKTAADPCISIDILVTMETTVSLPDRQFIISML